jgi:hypothetical protein
MWCEVGVQLRFFTYQVVQELLTENVTLLRGLGTLVENHLIIYI